MATNETNDGRIVLSKVVRDIDTDWGPGITTIGITEQQHGEFSKQKRVLSRVRGTPTNFSNYHAFGMQCNAYQALQQVCEDGTEVIHLPEERIAECQSRPLTSLTIKDEQHDRFKALKDDSAERQGRFEHESSYVMYDRLLIACDRVIDHVDTRDEGFPDFDGPPTIPLD